MYKPVFHPFLDPLREKEKCSRFYFSSYFKKQLLVFWFLFLMEKTNPVLILTKCVLHMCEASRFCSSRPFSKGWLAAPLVSDPPPPVVPTSLGPAPMALHSPVTTSASRDGWAARWPLHSRPSGSPCRLPEAGDGRPCGRPAGAGAAGDCQAVALALWAQPVGGSEPGPSL